MAQILMNAMRLGERLVAAGHLSRSILEKTLREQRQFGGRIGDRLLYAGRINARLLTQELADQRGWQRIDPQKTPFDAAESNRRDLSIYLDERWLPWRPGLIAAVDPTAEILSAIEGRYGRDVVVGLLTRRDFRDAVSERFGPVLTKSARDRLWQFDPRLSARRLPGDARLLAGIMGVTGLAAAAPFVPLLQGLFLWAANLLFLATLLLRIRLLQSLPARSRHSVSSEDWPIYTVLVPLFRETAVLPRLLRALSKLDYPPERLDVKLVLEEDDIETFEAAKRLTPPAYVEIVRVPAGQPRTKPKACNYALSFARGEFVTIYDAEDQPFVMQLKDAVKHFRAAGDVVSCLQARLNYFNREENLLTKCFAIEYAQLFDRIVPRLERHGIPVPLGGTSNHLRLATLREIGAWDPFNVTEDADLGLRLALAGYRTEALDSETLEEAPIQLGAWIVQRSRWIKGYLITWIVHTRDAGGLRRRLGRKSFWALHLFIGSASLIYLVSPVLWIQAVTLLLHTDRYRPIDATGVLCVAVLCFGTAVQWAGALSIIRQRKWRGMAIAVVIFPFYWWLHTLAAIRAVWQLIVAPYHWDKTEHGITRMSDNAALDLSRHGH